MLGLVELIAAVLRAVDHVEVDGDQDPQMPINQSHELHAAYKNLGLDVQQQQWRIVAID